MYLNISSFYSAFMLFAQKGDAHWIRTVYIKTKRLFQWNWSMNKPNFMSFSEKNMRINVVVAEMLNIASTILVYLFLVEK